MCLGLEAVGLIAPLIGSGLSMAGQMMAQNEAEENARRQAEARNKELRRTLSKNDRLAQESRDKFALRQRQTTAQEMDQNQEDLTQKRQDTLTDAVQPIKNESDTQNAIVPLRGSAPQVVRSELGQKMEDALKWSTGQAESLGKLGGYGDAWLDQGFKDNETGRDLSVISDFAGGNMSILPYAQDFAEHKAYRPASGVGGLLQGFGSFLGSFGGGGGFAVPRQSYRSTY
jgi:hypothetical protein